MAAWLDLVKENEAWNLVDTNRLEQLVQELPYPKSQYPSLLYFSGNPNRRKALRVLTKTAHTQNPILFAESGLCLEQRLGDSRWLKHSTTKHQTFPLAGADGTLTPARLQQELSGVKTSAAIQKATLYRLYRRWGDLRSTTTCVVCLCRPPEHMLPCKHAICDSCVVIFGNPSSLGEYHLEIAQCPICEESLYGGRLRGLIQLGPLRALESRIGIPIACLPDLCIGTGVGALSAIDIFLNQSSVTQSFGAFPDLARNIFRHSSEIPIPRCIRWLASAFNLTTDGLYDSDGLSQIFKAAPAGCRIAIVASRTSDGKACVLANYRGTSPRTTNTAYQFLAPRNDEESPSLCDASICSAGAPMLPGLGLLQDGGVRANNPLAIALRESSIIWPMEKRHDLLVSVRTGFSTSTPSESTGFLGRIREGALSRLFRAMVSSIYGHKAIDGTLPKLDDVCSLEAMSDMDFAVPAKLVRTILASTMFFFELDESPAQGNSSFHCRGSVLCSRPNPAEILQRVLVEFPGARFQSGQDLDLGSIDLIDICHLDERVSIEISNNTFRERIGGFPKSAQEFLNEQKAYAQFGRADHQNLDWPPRRSCYCYHGSRRLVHFLEPALGQKKRRL
ncbi:unnamed protein product [Penicillium nalgiovense]|uniref:RING-type domain-containing protein n=1 Tax=Penicillium nalgiovense TaxID=60175 RepID=A0A9W4HMH8_PENNA|nr:unnamed protein product [Penicillium nalgiovense]CAG8000476.1 unnamed protein product [Penicillium nalgiovense]CAG8014660.1 unnamed protein product [Penicillium nalgiovense]CAG8018310.1 unnamed protein product [Penicillium nalgiovense]CAG8022495.1 unnamed protein product [Penicillium nalgiovense]